MERLWTLDRALNLELLTNALGDHTRLPSPEDLRNLLSEVEVGLFTRSAEFEPHLLDAGWYLQSVATARRDLDLYDIVRQRQAHQVSAHIFDLALQSSEMTDLEMLQYTFASQIGYMGGELTPNAAALARRLNRVIEPEYLEDPGIASLEVGVLLLALDRPSLNPLLDKRLDQLNSLVSQFDNIQDSPYAAADGVVRGAYELTSFLTYGRSLALSTAREHFRRALESRGAPNDIDSRWVAAHLLQLSDGLETSSVWRALPPNLPGAARAMTLGDPPVLQLWPPQLNFLAGDLPEEPSPLDAAVRRMILSFPTSAGKSLLAQLLVVTHVVEKEDDVCVVAPTRSLCRELRASLRPRLRTLGRQLHVDTLLGYDAQKPTTARAVVMTPEKLAGRLRKDPTGLLNEFGMFVIDEAHLVANESRGWLMEETLSLLHHLTRNRRHRILVLSAALGSQVHVKAWLNSGDGVFERHESWRGPRRLSAIYTTNPDWDSVTLRPREGQRLARRTWPLKGIVHLRTGLSGEHVPKTFSEPVGQLVQRRTRQGSWQRDGTSTTQDDQLLPLIAHIRTTGSVLVVKATKNSAQRLAAKIADPLEEDPATFALVDLVRTRLGSEHPLARVVPKGVAFHHAALPVDIQSEIEDAVRSEQIGCLVATTTVTEGVNLPFKSVVIAERGFRSADGFVNVVDAAQLLNAVGRAGRAGRETEGWLILAEHQPFSPTMFQLLDQNAPDLEMLSTMVSEAALNQLADLEERARADEDAIFASFGAEADGFVRSVWLIAQALTEMGDAPTDEDVIDAIRATLAWQQLDDAGKAKFIEVASRAFRAYSERPAEQRKRWAQSGMSLPSAVSLDALAQQVLEMITEEIATSEFPDAIHAILEEERLENILKLSENQRIGFKRSRNSRRDDQLPVDVKALLIDWVSGVELQALVDEHLEDVARKDYRYEQLAEFVSSVFEHFLPWALGTIFDWVNAELEAQDVSFRIPAEIAAAVHYGVGTRDALNLMVGGVRSRRLANRVAEKRISEGPADEGLSMRDWLASQDISTWRSEFDASPTEVADLLAFAQDPNVQLVNRVLESEEYSIPYIERAPVLFESGANLADEPDQPAPSPIAIFMESDIVGTIGTDHHDDVALLTGIGIPLDIRVGPSASGPQLLIRLAPEIDG